MPKNSVNEWDSTAANNTDVGGISIAEGMAPANVNNAMREIMAQVKSAVSTWINPATTDSRTSDSATTLLQAKAMNDHRTSGDHDGRYTQRNSNLSDLQSAATARTNLGLGTAATAALGTSSGEIRTNAQNDTRFAPARYTSPETAITIGTLITLTHGLGGVPDVIRGQMVNRSGSIIRGWAEGEGPEVALPDYGNTGYWWDLRRSSTQIQIRPSGALVVPDKSTGVVASISTADWRLVVTAIRWGV